MLHGHGRNRHAVVGRRRLPVKAFVYRHQSFNCSPFPLTCLFYRSNTELTRSTQVGGMPRTCLRGSSAVRRVRGFLDGRRRQKEYQTRSVAPTCSNLIERACRGVYQQVHPPPGRSSIYIHRGRSVAAATINDHSHLTVCCAFITLIHPVKHTQTIEDGRKSRACSPSDLAVPPYSE